MAVAAACVLAVLTTSLVYWKSASQHSSRVVLRQPPIRDLSPRHVNAMPDQADLRETLPELDPVLSDDPPAEQGPEGAESASEEGTGDDSSASEPAEGALESPAVPQVADTRLAASSIIELINQQLRDRWTQMQVLPAPAIGDRGWCERIYLQLIGRAPRSQELRAFFAEPASSRRQWLVDRLLGSEYSQDLAGYWAGNLTDWWLQGIEVESRAFRIGLQAHLTEQLLSARPLDETYAELIAASGSNDPSRSDFHGATNYLLALTERAEPADLTAQICRAALGQRVACAACHDAPIAELQQANFWQITATLATVHVELLRPGRGRLRDVPAGSQVGLTYKSPEGEELRAAPAGLDGEALIPSGDRSPRAMLAEQIVGSTQFARATVNRLWESMLHYGFTLPVDDMGTHNPVSHPELVERLAEQLRLHRYQLPEMLRWIALSDAFDRSEVIMSASGKDAPVEGGTPLFSRYYHRPRLFAEASEGLDQLAAGQSPQVTYSGDERELQAIFSRRYGGPGDEGLSVNTTSDQMGQLLPGHYLSRIRSLANEDLTREGQFEHAYWMVLGRRPTPAELARAEAIYRAAGDDPVVALERLVWTLLNVQP
jgi:hypothetical protein